VIRVEWKVDIDKQRISAFVQHILDQGHQYGPVEQIMELIEYARKGNIMNITEYYYIYNLNNYRN
jgi:hypothetical protein